MRRVTGLYERFGVRYKFIYCFYFVLEYKVVFFRLGRGLVGGNEVFRV